MASRFVLAVVVLGLSAAGPFVSALHSRSGSSLQGRQALAARADDKHHLTAALRPGMNSSHSGYALLQTAPRASIPSPLLFPERISMFADESQRVLSAFQHAIDALDPTPGEMLYSIPGPQRAPSLDFANSNHHDTPRLQPSAQVRRRHKAKPKPPGEVIQGFDFRRVRPGADGISLGIHSKDSDSYANYPAKGRSLRRSTRSSGRSISKKSFSSMKPTLGNSASQAVNTSDATRVVWTTMNTPDLQWLSSGEAALSYFNYKDPLKVMVLDFMKDIIEREKINVHINDIVPEPRHLYADAHCVGEPGWLNLSTNLPDSFCVYDQAWGYRFGGHFDEFSTERFLLGRWMQSPQVCGNNERMGRRLPKCNSNRIIDLIVAPSLHLHHMREQVDNHTYEWEVMWTNNIAQHVKYWELLRRIVTKQMADTKASRPPLVLVHHAYTFDTPFSGNMLMSLLKQPAWFVNTVVIATIESNLPSDKRAHLPRAWSSSAEVLRTHREDGTLKSSEGVPTLVTVPYPVPVVSNTVKFSSISPGYDHNKFRQISLMLNAASKGDGHGNNRIRYHVRKEMEKAGAICSLNTCLFCDGHFEGKPKCHPDFLDNASYAHEYSSLSYVWDFATSATFCLEPPGDTLTRSHFYVAALAGCIPVIFDGGHRSFARLNTSWPWRRMAGESGHNGLNYDTFTVRYKAGDILSGKVDFVKELSEMPTKHPGRFRNLRKGLDAALPALHYSLDDCGTKDCDAFAHLRDYVYRMRRMRATQPFQG